jgi:ATP-binding cassette subfamily C (CFTR/MRP) protein 4
MRISINVHNKMFGSLVRAPVKFFDENPSGRVMNRFTKDLCSMDESLPSVCFDVMTIFLVMLGVIIVVILSNYYVIIPSTLLVIALWIIRRFYIRTARDVKRIEAISKL